MQSERQQETSGSPSQGCEVLWGLRSVRLIRRLRIGTFERVFWRMASNTRIWMRCENDRCFHPNHMELISVWEMGRRYQERVVTPAKERRKWL